MLLRFGALKSKILTFQRILKSSISYHIKNKDICLSISIKNMWKEGTSQERFKFSTSKYKCLNPINLGDLGNHTYFYGNNFILNYSVCQDTDYWWALDKKETPRMKMALSRPLGILAKTESNPLAATWVNSAVGYCLDSDEISACRKYFVLKGCKEEM